MSWMVLGDSDFELKVEDWGCMLAENQLMPIKMDMEVEPENLLKVVWCKCKSGTNQCGSNLCTCHKYGLLCTPTCRCHDKECLDKMVCLLYILSSKCACFLVVSIQCFTYGKIRRLILLVKKICGKQLWKNEIVSKDCDYMQKWAHYNNHLANFYTGNLEAENPFTFVIEALILLERGWQIHLRWRWEDGWRIFNLEL